VIVRFVTVLHEDDYTHGRAGVGMVQGGGADAWPA
jgi:hypothetical protein